VAEKQNSFYFGTVEFFVRKFVRAFNSYQGRLDRNFSQLLRKFYAHRFRSLTTDTSDKNLAQFGSSIRRTLRELNFM